MNKNKEERRRIGQRIAEERKARGLTQQQLADCSGIKQPHIARIEGGVYSVGFDTLNEIAGAMGLKIDIVEK